MLFCLGWEEVTDSLGHRNLTKEGLFNEKTVGVKRSFDFDFETQPAPCQLTKRALHPTKQDGSSREQISKYRDDPQVQTLYAPVRSPKGEKAVQATYFEKPRGYYLALNKEGNLGVLTRS